MKGVLMSIRPEWCELIASGKKTVEIRKTIPRKFVHDGFYGGYVVKPFKVYIYETQGYSATPQVFEDGTTIFRGRGKVIGEFVCDRIHRNSEVVDGLVDFGLALTSCMEPDEIVQYANGKLVYSWHISDLVIYDKPKELGEFKRPCVYRNDDGSCKFRTVCCPHTEFDYNPDGSVNLAECRDGIKRPPQSWCYVEVKQ